MLHTGEGNKDCCVFVGDNYKKITIGGGRKSQYELLRLIAQYFIVFYHLLLIFIVPYSDNSWLQAIEIPLHIGVILFVLLSGFFGIKASYRGLFKLLLVFTVYSLPEVVYNISQAENFKQIGKSLLFFSHTHFWFIRTYLFLYLLSPMVNLYINNLSPRKRIYTLISLFFVCTYIGTSGGDPMMSDGKNVVNFIFLYMIGNTLSTYKHLFEKVKLIKLLFVWGLFNFFLVLSYAIFDNTFIGSIIWRLSFPYCSPLLLLNSILFFLIFSKMSFYNWVINWLAKSSLAIYLIHANRPLFIKMAVCSEDRPGGVLGYMVNEMQNYATNDFHLVLCLLLVSFIVIIIAIGIDKLLTPIWRGGDWIYNRISNNYNKIYST